MEPKVAICCPTLEMSKQARFWDFYNVLDKPVGSVCFTSHGQSPAMGRNLMIQGALEADCTHVLFLDDDMTFQPDTLRKLLAHDVDMVSGLYLLKGFPNQPLIFDVVLEGGKQRWMDVTDDMQGLIEVVGSGFGCVLIKTEVFLAMEKPWVRLGEIDPEQWCDDLGFYNRARALGFKLFVDLDIPCGHMGTVTISPSRRDGKWYVDYDTNGTERVSFLAKHLEQTELDKRLVGAGR